MLCKFYFLIKLPAVNVNARNHTHTDNLMDLHNSLSGKALYNSITRTEEYSDANDCAAQRLYTDVYAAIA